MAVNGYVHLRLSPHQEILSSSLIFRQLFLISFGGWQVGKGSGPHMQLRPEAASGMRICRI